MSDTHLKLKIQNIIQKSGYSKSNKMLCPILKIVTMRHADVSQQQLLRVTKDVLRQ